MLVSVTTIPILPFVEGMMAVSGAAKAGKKGKRKGEVNKATRRKKTRATVTPPPLSQ
jgi:hypothetical protein